MSVEPRRQKLSGPVGSGEYVVQEGDCISSIAFRSGHFWKTLWEYPDNVGLRQARQDPAILLPGDRLTVPALRMKEESRATDQKHRFVRKGIPVKMRLRLMIADDSNPSVDSPVYKPRANQHYTLVLEGNVVSGQTDGNGMIELAIPPTARSGKLTVGPDKMECELALGCLDPTNNILGVQGRLNNLGYYCGPPNAELNDETRTALRLFQQEYDLDQTGEPDEATIGKLNQLHGS